MSSVDTLLEVSEDGVKTRCSNCVFCVAPHGKQVGCRFFDRFDKFRKKKQVEYEDDYFYIKRLCNAGRPKQWGEEQPNSNILEWRDKVQKDIEIDCDVVIVESEETDLDVIVEKLALTCKLVKKSILPPERVIIVADTPIIELAAAVRPMFDDTSIMPIFVRNFDKVIPVAISKSASSYITFVENGVKFDINLTYRLNAEINYGLEKIVAVLPGVLNGTTFRAELHKHMIERELDFEFDTLYDTISELGYEHTIRKSI